MESILEEEEDRSINYVREEESPRESSFGSLPEIKSSASS